LEKLLYVINGFHAINVFAACQHAQKADCLSEYVVPLHFQKYFYLLAPHMLVYPQLLSYFLSGHFSRSSSRTILAMKT